MLPRVEMTNLKILRRNQRVKQVSPAGTQFRFDLSTGTADLGIPFEC